MSEMFDDLKKLSEMLEKGEITQAEYDKIKSDLVAESEESTPPENPMAGKAAGWYSDPSGKAQNQAYWDGEKWTGETASVGGQKAAPKKSNVGRIVLIVVLAVIAIPILALIAVSLAGDEVSETFAEVASGLNQGTNPPATNPPATSPPGGFAPFTVSGSGDDFANFSTPDNEPAALTISHTGSSNFSVTSYTAGNDYIDLLVNEIGNYRGTVATNFLVGEDVGQLEITADGPWTITATYIGDLPIQNGSATGTGDDVVRISINNAAVDVGHNGDSNFSVWVWSENGRDLVVNEIGSYSGTIRSDTGVVFYQINANGQWTVNS